MSSCSSASVIACEEGPSDGLIPEVAGTCVALTFVRTAYRCARVDPSVEVRYISPVR